MDENQITNKTEDTSSPDNTSQTSSPFETAKDPAVENAPAKDNVADTTADPVKTASSDDTASAKRTSAFDIPAASDAYETASSAATTPVSSAFENTKPAASPASYYSAPDTTMNTADTGIPAPESKPSFTTAPPASSEAKTAPFSPASSDFYTSTDSTYTAEVSKGFAIASLVMGILGILTSCCCGMGTLFCILGIIFGCVQPKDANGQKPGLAIAGIITSCVGLLLSILGILYFVLIGSVQ